jgi:hypothetical protein
MPSPRFLAPSADAGPVAKVRIRNKLAEKQLEVTMSSLDQKCNWRCRRIQRSIMDAEQLLQNMEEERSRSFPRNSYQNSLYSTSGTASPTSGTVSPEQKRQSVVVSSNTTCQYNTTTSAHQCLHFPCLKPKTYHSLGYMRASANTKWMSWRDLRHVVREAAAGSPTGPGSATVSGDSGGVSRFVALQREEELKDEMQRRRIVHRQDKPPCWQTNYGKPTPFKRLKYPVRLQPLSTL